MKSKNIEAYSEKKYWFLSGGFLSGTVKDVWKKEFCIFPFFPQSTLLNKYLMNEFESLNSFSLVVGIKTN